MAMGPRVFLLRNPRHARDYNGAGVHARCSGGKRTADAYMPAGHARNASWACAELGVLQRHGILNKCGTS